MPPITPTTEIYVCKGVGFDSTYQHVRLFDDLNARLAYFRGKQAYYTNNATPIRIRDGMVYVDKVADEIYDADYIVFRNRNFNENKWHFAFITEPPTYAAESTSAIHFEIDDMQTYFPDVTLSPSYVERMHWPTDNIGDNLVAENIELGDYVSNHNTRTNFFNSYSIVVACTTSKSGAPSPGGFYGGIYSGLSLLEFTSVTELNDFITQMVDDNKSSAIQAIFMMPKEFITNKSTDINSTAAAKAFIYSAPERNRVDGYTPVNKKLLTSPYKILQVSNLSGNSADYAYEYFSNAGVIFNIFMDYTPNPTAKLSPAGYNNYSDTENAYDFGLTLNGFPQCAWNTDSYLAWLAQTGSVSALGTTFTGQDLAFAQQGIGAIGSVLSGNILGAASSFLGIAQNVAKVNATKSLPPQAHGQTANGAMVSFRAKDFFFTDLSVRQEFARIIDGYWTKYGYPCHELRTLNYTSRRSFNFIKTQGAHVSGDVPQHARANIQRILDNGVTFWHTDNIGNYYLNNDPI